MNPVTNLQLRGLIFQRFALKCLNSSIDGVSMSLDAASCRVSSAEDAHNPTVRRAVSRLQLIFYFIFKKGFWFNLEINYAARK